MPLCMLYCCNSTSYFTFLLQGKCQRKDPPCKYLHPPQHLREQLLQNGRNNLILRNLQLQAMATGLQPMVPPQFATTVVGFT